MNDITNNLKLACEDVKLSSVGGSPFLIAYGLSFLMVAVLSLYISARTVALAAMFQGGAALPLALWMERRLGKKRMSADNPLKPLSIQLAVSQVLSLPVLIAVYSVEPKLIPLALASLGGVHFMPYAWLHNSKMYIYLATAISMGAYIIQLALAANEFEAILFWVGLVYLMAVLSIYRSFASTVRMGFGDA